jgi:CRP-like cAMP-binding protein
MIAHVCQRMRGQRRGKIYELPGIRRDRGRRIVMVSMLSEGESCAAGSQGCGGYGYQDSHRSSLQAFINGRVVRSGETPAPDQAHAQAEDTSCHSNDFHDMIIIMSDSIERFLKGLRVRQRHIGGGQSLFHRGDAVKEMHFVLTGSIHLVRHQSDGSVLILQRTGPGSILAEASLYSESYHCDAVASGASETRAYAKASFKKLLAKSPEFSGVWAGYLARELQGARLRSEILSLKTVADRLDAWIAWNGGGFPNRGEWKLVANEIGVSPEAFYREIAKRRR